LLLCFFASLLLCFFASLLRPPQLFYLLFYDKHFRLLLLINLG
jgi:hypothetical protein